MDISPNSLCTWTVNNVWSLHLTSSMDSFHWNISLTWIYYITVDLILLDHGCIIYLSTLLHLCFPSLYLPTSHQLPHPFKEKGSLFELPVP